MQYETKLYIVKENDSLEKISIENNIPISEIIRLNPLSKHRLIEGQPLILNIPIKENTRDNYNSSNIHNDCKITKLFYTYKELLICTIYYPFAFDILAKSFNDIFYKISNDNELFNLLCSITNIPTLLNNKTEKELLQAQQEINTQVENLKLKYNSTSTNINELFENIELFIIKILNENYKEANNYYNLFEIELCKLLGI